MSGRITVFVNETPLRLHPGITVAEAVASFDQQMARDISDGRAYVTDGIGLRRSATECIAAGDILRVVGGGRRGHDHQSG